MKTYCLLLVLAAAVSQNLVRAQEPLAELRNRINFLEEHAKRDDKDYHSLVSLGLAFMEKARLTGEASYYPQAQAEFENALKIQFDSIDAILGMAEVLSAQHKFKEALVFTDKGLAAEPFNTLALGLKGDVLYSVGDVQNAEVYYRKVADGDSGGFLQSRLANLCFINGDLAGEQKAMEAAIAAVPTNFTAELAWNKLKLGSHYVNCGNL